MKTLVLALLATSAISLAAPAAMAQPYGDHARYGASRWDGDRNDRGGYGRGGHGYGRGSAQFDRQYDDLQNDIRRAYNDGVFNRDQLKLFTNALRAVGDRADQMRRNGSYDARDLQGRLNYVRQRFDAAERQGYDRLRRAEGYGDRRYGYRR